MEAIETETETDDIPLMLYSRVEVYLRFRFAYLAADERWLEDPTDDDMPHAVRYVLENCCCRCLHKDIGIGDWEKIDHMLLRFVDSDWTPQSLH